jgi:hypothetical protein
MTLAGLKQYTGGVRCHEPAARGDQDPQHLRHVALRKQPAAQRLALNELHRHEHHLLVRAHVERGDDIGVRKLGERLSLAQQSLPVVAPLTDSGVARVQDLQRDVARQVRIVRAVDAPHSARTDLLDELVATDGEPWPDLGARRLGWWPGRLARSEPVQNLRLPEQRLFHRRRQAP